MKRKRNKKQVAPIVAAPTLHKNYDGSLNISGLTILGEEEGIVGFKSEITRAGARVKAFVLV